MKNMLPSRLMKKSICLSLLALSVIAYSCKKDKDKSAQDRLIGKWTATMDKWNTYYNGSNHYDSSTYSSGEYNLEFKSNGTVVAIDAYGRNDTTTFKLVDGDKKIVFDGTDTVTLTILTDKDLQLYGKEGTATSYYEEWDNYKKL
jgi:hypothetical protein